MAMAAATAVDDNMDHIVDISNVDLAVTVHVGRVRQDDVANDAREALPAVGSPELVGTAHGHVERPVLIGLVFKHILVDDQRLALIHFHVPEFLTTMKGFITDVCQRGGKGQRCERAAAVERLVANPLYRIGDNEVNKITAAHKRIVPYRFDRIWD